MRDPSADKETHVTQTINFIEPTEAQLREKVFTLETIRMDDVWLAALLGSAVAQRVVGCPDLHMLLLDRQPKDIGTILLIYDAEDKAVSSRIALSLAMALLPKWQERFPADTLGDEVLADIALSCRSRRQDRRLFERGQSKLGYGKYGQTAESAALISLLGVTCGTRELHLGDINSVMQLDVQPLVLVIARKLVPWLLGRHEILLTV